MREITPGNIKVIKLFLSRSLKILPREFLRVDKRQFAQKDNPAKGIKSGGKIPFLVDTRGVNLVIEGYRLRKGVSYEKN